MVLCAQAAPKSDPRFKSITAKELKQRIQETPISSPQHALLTARGRSAKLQKLVYEQYTLVWKKKLNDGHANLRRGIAAQNYWEHIRHTTKTRLPATFYELHGVIRGCLSKAVELMPNSPSANVAYGFFLWQWDNQMNSGLALLKKAVTLDAKDARAHANLGNVYANRSGNAYDPRKAEEELRLATQLDSTYAYPYWLMVSLYVNTKRYKDAEQALHRYLSLTPPSAAQGMRIYQSAIDRGLNRS